MEGVRGEVLRELAAEQAVEGSLDVGAGDDANPRGGRHGDRREPGGIRRDPPPRLLPGDAGEDEHDRDGAVEAHAPHGIVGDGAGAGAERGEPSGPPRLGGGGLVGGEAGVERARGPRAGGVPRQRAGRGGGLRAGVPEADDQQDRARGEKRRPHREAELRLELDQRERDR